MYKSPDLNPVPIDERKLIRIIVFPNCFKFCILFIISVIVKLPKKLQAKRETSSCEQSTSKCTKTSIPTSPIGG